jgi:hypothetical protein
MNYNAKSERAEPRSRELAVKGPPAPTAYEGTATLAHLKNRLLRETLEGAPGEPLGSLLRLTATEAEAQAWLTSFPLLLFPVLFEEKAEQVRRYAARQSRLRPGCHAARSG